MKRIYIAGPLTGGSGDRASNVRRAIEAGHELMDLGYAVFIPHLSHFAHLIRFRAYEDWMEHDLEWLSTCHALLRLFGLSEGADREVARAIALGIPVFYSIKELFDAFPP